MNKLLIREYKKGERRKFSRLIMELQDYLVEIDPVKLARRLPQYEKSYIDRVFAKVKKYHGKIYFGEIDGEIMGCVAGIIEKQSVNDLLESQPIRAGRVLELFVAQKLRGKGIGRALMEKMEDYLRSQGCDTVFVSAFGPNIRARSFYEYLGYQARNVDFIRVLR